MDHILLPEMKKLHEILRQEERMLSPEDKKSGHMGFVKHCEEIIRYSNVVRKEGLLALEEIADEKEKDWDGAFDTELIRMVVDGCDPELIKRIILLKYFSTEQDVCQKIKNIMSIYGLLSIQAGENPRLILQMLTNMIPEDVQDIAKKIDFMGKVQSGTKEVIIDDYCKGPIRLREKDFGYFETKLCEDMIISLSQNSVQRVLRDIDTYSLMSAMKVFSGECRRHIFNNMSSREGQDLARGLREDDPEDEKTYYLHSEWEIKRIREEMIKILTIINRLSSSAEILLEANSDVGFLSLILSQITIEANNKKEKGKEYDRLINAFKYLKQFDLGDN